MLFFVHFPLFSFLLFFSLLRLVLSLNVSLPHFPVSFFFLFVIIICFSLHFLSYPLIPHFSSKSKHQTIQLSHIQSPQPRISLARHVIVIISGFILVKLKVFFSSVSSFSRLLLKFIPSWRREQQQQQQRRASNYFYIYFSFACSLLFSVFHLFLLLLHGGLL